MNVPPTESRKMVNATMSRVRIQTGAILIVHRSSSECAHCGMNVINTRAECPGCSVTFHSMATTMIMSDTDKQVREMLDTDSFGHLRHIGWAAGGVGDWRISADPYAAFSKI